MQYRKSALAIFLSILILFSTSLFLYSCGVSNPTGSGGGHTGTTGLSALTGPVVQKAYVSGMKVSVIDMQTNKMINQIDLWGGFAAGMAINPKTNKLYAADINNNRLLVIDTNINFIVSIFPVGTKPYGVTVNTLTNKIYVTNSGNNTVSVVNGVNNSVIATIPVGTQPERIAVDEVTNTIYVANSMGNSVSIINGNTNQVVNTIAVTGKPMDVAVDPSITQAYVTTSGNITVLDTASQALKTNIMIPAGTPSLNRIAVNQITHQAYISTTNSNLLVVVDGSANKVIGTTSNTAPVSNIALDDVTNKLYLDNWAYFGDSMTKTMSGDHKVNVADLSNIRITTTSPSIPSALNILSTVIFSWTAPLQFNMILVDGDIVVVDTAPRTTTPPPVTPPNNPPPKLTGLSISPTSATIYIHTKDPAKSKQQYTAKDSNGVVVTNSVAWQSDKPTIAAINAAGLATPPLPLSTATPGIAIITASANGVISNKAELCVDCWEYTHYRQNLGAWKDDPFAINWDVTPARPRNQQDLKDAIPSTIGGEYGNMYSYSIAGKGCYMVSAAMALTAATGTPITPGALNYVLQTNGFSAGYGYVRKTNAVDWQSIKNLYPSANISYIEDGTTTSGLDTILQNCDMAIIFLDKASGPYQNGRTVRLHPYTHFILVAKGKNGKYKIYDPWIMLDKNGTIIEKEVQMDDLTDPTRELNIGWSGRYVGIVLKK